MAVPIRRIAVAVLLACPAMCFPDQPGLALGYQFLPHLPVGLSLSLLDTFGFLGIDATLNAGGSRSEHERADRFSTSLGVNLATPVALYPILAISSQHIRRTRADVLIENRTTWGIDAKLTGILFSRAGITIGFRAPFEDPLHGSAILGVSLVLLRQEPPRSATNPSG